MKADDPGFAEDLTDGRADGDWESIYSPEARKHIRLEAWTLVMYMAAGVTGTFVLIWQLPSGGIGTEPQSWLAPYLGTALAGLLGGTAFSLKWLYHSVAKKKWHLDRRLWRYLTPLISGIVAVLFTATILSGLFGIFDGDVVEWPSGFLAIGGLVGYFSDLAIGKLSEVAQTLFGSERSKP